MHEDYERKGIHLDDYGDGSKPRGSRLKFMAALLGMVLVALVIYSSVYVYSRIEGRKQAEIIGEQMKQDEAALQQRMMADTYGGKTPQETLRMYIAAVEKGDYVLASKYFIFDKQEKELNSLQKSKPDDLKNIISLLKQSLTSEGSYSWDKKYFGIDRPISSYMLVYPTGIWKIIEI